MQSCYNCTCNNANLAAQLARLDCANNGQTGLPVQKNGPIMAFNISTSIGLPVKKNNWANNYVAYTFFRKFQTDKNVFFLVKGLLPGC